LAGLDEIKDDLKCNGKEPNEANCNLGNITIFNGEARKCGDYVPKYCGSNICKCCDDSKAFWGMGHCSSSSKQLGQDKADGKCAQVGTWTEKKKLLFVRVDYKKWKGYCCYKSKLARIIQEQGRPQIKAYYYNNPSRGDPSSMDWGSAKNPNCRGFTSVEFQVLDFSKIDLSEFFGDMNIDPQRINDQLDELDKHQDNAGWRDNMEDKANDKEQQERMKDAEEVREGM
jgi:conjugal transfer mating pair stabilization protein TraN